VSQAEPENPALPKPAVAEVPDDILSAIGSKFFPSAVAKAYGSAVYGYGKTKIAFVGVPCHVLALRKMEAWQHKISENLKIIIGLFCFGTFSLSPLLEHITKTYKIKSSDIKFMRLSSKFVVQTKDETIRIPLSEIKDHILPSCRTCTDFTAELADISVGSAYPLSDWSTVIIRSKAGEDFFFNAVENGVISTWVIEQEANVSERLMIAAMQKRNSALKVAKEIEEAYGFLPVLMLRETDVLAKIKVEDIMTKNITAVPETTTINKFLDLVAKSRHMGYPVVNDKGETVGVVTLEEAAKVEQANREKTPISKISRLDLISVSPGETALDAFRKMEKHETGRILVMDAANPKKLLGIITKTDLMHIMTNSVENTP
jgi:CBS domain-containing protein